jgi:hypothetical protein
MARQKEAPEEKDTPQQQGNEENDVIRENNPASYPNQNEQIVVRDKKPTAVAGYTVGDVGTGFEDFTQDDLAVPFVVILQKGNPQVEEENPKFIPGAKPGMLMNNVTNRLYDGKETGIVVIPVHRVRQFLEWIPKDDGGGLVNVFEPDAPEVKAVLAEAGRKKYGKLSIGDGNDLVETFNVFALQVLPNGLTERIVLAFASSQIGGYKKWMTSAQSIQIIEDGRPKTPPLFSHKYRLKTFYHQKKENSWFKWTPSFDGGSAETARLADGDPIFEQAKEFRALLMAGHAEASYKDLTADVPEAGDDFEM